MDDLQDLQEEGEAVSEEHGIDGTMGDAQDVMHPYIESYLSLSCIVCGLGEPASPHQRWNDAT